MMGAGLNPALGEHFPVCRSACAHDPLCEDNWWRHVNEIEIEKLKVNKSLVNILSSRS